MDRLATGVLHLRTHARMLRPGAVLQQQLRRFARKARQAPRAADVEAIPFFEQMPHEKVSEDFEDRFDESNTDSVLEDVSNTQLRKMRPGVGRARALFETPDFPADPGTATSSTRKDSKARFRVANLRPDDALVREDGTVESIIKDGRAEREEQLQQQKKRLEKEKALRARQRPIQEMAGSDKGEETPPQRAAELQVKKSPGQLHKTASAETEPLAKDDAGGQQVPAVEQGTADEAPLFESTVSPDFSSFGAFANGSAASQQDAGITEALSPDQMLQRVSGALSNSAASRAAPSRGPRHMRSPPFSSPWTAAVGHQPRGGQAALRERLAAAESSAGILAVVAGHEKEIDSAHAVAALSMVARSASSTPVGRKGFPNDQQMLPLLRRLASHIDSLTPMELCDVLSALARLGISPAWVGQALSRAEQNSPAFDSRCAATALLALGRLNAAAAPEQAAKLVLALRRVLLSRPEEELRMLDALEVVSLSAALARLRVRDPSLFRPLTTNLIEFFHEGAESGLVLSDVISSIRAVAIVGHAAPSFVIAAEHWLSGVPLVAVDDFVALCSAIQDVPADAKEALAAKIVRPWLLRLTAADNCPVWCAALAAADRASVSDDPTRDAVAEALARSQADLIGREIGIVARALAPAASRPTIYKTLSSQAARTAPDFLPGELVEVLTGFARASVEAPDLWPILQAALLRAAPRLHARDAARALLALSTVQASRPDAIRALADTTASGSSGLPSEEALNLLKYWPQLHAEVRMQQPALPRRLALRLTEDLGSTSAGSWRAPPEPLVAAFSWIASWDRSCGAIGSAETAALGEVADQTLLALLPMMSRMVAAMEPLRALTVVSELGLSSRSSNVDATRFQLQSSSALRDALDEAFAELGSAVPVGAAGAQLILGLAAVGLDGATFRAWVRRRLVDNPGLPEMGALCWACAEIRSHAPVVLECVRQEMTKAAPVATESGFGALESAAWLRMAWAALVLEGDNALVSALLERCSQITAAEHGLLSAAELRGLRQLAWQSSAWGSGSRSGSQVQKWASTVLAGAAEMNASTRVVCTALGRLGIEHVPAGQPPLREMPCIGAVAVLPKQRVALVVRSPYDQTASGGSAGGAALRQQQLEAAGMGTVLLELPSSRTETATKNGSTVAAHIASALVRALPGDFADLSTIAATLNAESKHSEVDAAALRERDTPRSDRQKRRPIKRPRG